MRSSRLCALIVLLSVSALATEPVFAAGRGGGGRSGAGKSGGHRGHHHHRHFIGGGVFLGSWYYPGWSYPAWYYPGYAVMEPWAVPYYVERTDEQDAGAGWLFCPGANTYFPTVIECGSGWVRVPAQP